MKFQDSNFNGLKVTLSTKSVTHQRTHAPKAICPRGGGGGGGGVGLDVNAMLGVGGDVGYGGCEPRIEGIV